MNTSNPTLKSNIRNATLAKYRSRGKNVSNLWLVYSPKTDSDWILPSDRQLIHWLYYLEANSEVQSFNVQPEPILSQDDDEVRATELDAIVYYRNGQQEWHEVKAGTDRDEPSHHSQKTAQTIAACKARVSYRRFNDLDLKPVMKIAMRWFKAIGYAAAIRGEQHTRCNNELVMLFKELKSGNISNILNKMDEYDSAIVIGLVIRMAIKGLIRIDLSKTTFGLLTPWEFQG
ncbi:hypothetical protein GALL_193910 [mine drainage metagenome]|uniref:TnsA endonuclease N-terminal domain-containing protein n=1 Tax=mine drainage metagenome TaxID=410659 RepID=A0A1J5RRF7_9ZZZZ